MISDNFSEIGYSIQENKHSIYHSFITVIDCPKDCITLRKSETINYKWISENEFIEFMKTEEMGKEQKERYSNYVETLKKLKNNK